MTGFGPGKCQRVCLRQSAAVEHVAGVATAAAVDWAWQASKNKTTCIRFRFMGGGAMARAFHQLPQDCQITASCGSLYRAGTSVRRFVNNPLIILTQPRSGRATATSHPCPRRPRWARFLRRPAARGSVPVPTAECRGRATEASCAEAGRVITDQAHPLSADERISVNRPTVFQYSVLCQTGGYPPV